MKDQSQLVELQAVLATYRGGLAQATDRAREVMSLLVAHAPELFRAHPRIGIGMRELHGFLEELRGCEATPEGGGLSWDAVRDLPDFP